MKTAFFADLLTLKSSALQTFVIILLVSAFVGAGMNNAIAIVPIAVATALVSLSFTLPALDEQNNWQAYRAALPLTRGDIIAGRALAIAAATAVVTLLAIVLTVLFYLVAIAFPHLGLSTDGLNVQNVTLAAASALAVCALIYALVMPLIAKFGLTKAVRFIPLAFLAVFFLALWAMNSADATGALSSAFEHILADGAWPTAAGTFGIGVVLYALGTAASARLYATRAF